MSAEADKGCMTDNSKIGHIAMEGRFTTFSADTKMLWIFLIFTMSGVSTKGVRSRLKVPNIWASPRNFPKSMWNRWPLCFTIILSLCRSQMPRMYVTMLYPAQDPGTFRGTRFKFSRLGGRQACRQTGLSSIIAI